MGIALYKQERWEEALSEFEKAFELDPNLDKSYLQKVRRKLVDIKDKEEGDVFISNNYGFKLPIPPGWEIDPSDGKLEVTIRNRELFSLCQVGVIDSVWGDPDIWANEFLNEFEDTPEVKRLSSRILEIDGDRAYNLTYLILSPEARLKARLLLRYHEEAIYYFLGTALEKGYEEASPYLDSIMENIEFGRRYNLSDYGLSLALPPGWRRLEAHSFGNEEFGAKIDITRAYPFDRENYISELLAEFERAKGVKQISREEGVLNKEKIELVLYQIFQGDLHLNGRLAVIPHRDLIYILFGTVPEENYEKARKDIQAIIHSLRFENI